MFDVTSEKKAEEFSKKCVLVVDGEQPSQPWWIEEFIKTGEYWVTKKGLPLVDGGGDSIVYDKGVFYILQESFPYGVVKNTDICIFIAVGSAKAYKKNYLFVLLNGDDTAFGNYELDGVTISYECLRRLSGLLDIKAFCNAVKKDRFFVVDWTPDTTRRLTPKEEEKKLRFKENVIPPVGFSFVHGQWHRSATVLIYDKKKEVSYLIGQDEGTYFGVELQDNPNSIKEAFFSLMPEEIRGKRCLRQGEWFAYPMSKVEVAKVGGFSALRLMVTSEANSSFKFSLPRDDVNSNEHEVIAQEAIFLDGFICVRDFSMSHPEHIIKSSMEGQTWYKIIKNTAVRSFSVAGVD